MRSRTEPAKKTTHLSASDDPDDDHLYVASGKSYKEKPDDSLIMKAAQSIIYESRDRRKRAPLIHSKKTPISGVLTSKNVFDDEENTPNYSVKHNEDQSVTSASSNSDKQIVIIPSDSETIDQTQQLESSMINQQVDDQSFVSKFDFLDETETNEHTLRQYLENENDRVKSSGDQRDQSNFQSDTENRHKEIKSILVSSAPMVFGEAYIHCSDVYSI
jgi:hypothetical protein